MIPPFDVAMSGVRWCGRRREVEGWRRREERVTMLTSRRGACGESGRRRWQVGLCLSALLMSATWKPALALTAGNTIYQVHVEDQSPGVGLYTVTTGSAHPAGQGLNVLFGGGNPSTTFNT